MNECQLIERYFQNTGTRCSLGIGDDAAVVAGMGSFVISTDSFVEGVHFFKGTPPRAVGWKALAASLSDVLAMGTTPCYALLALSIPCADAQWLQAFSDGFFSCAHHYHVQLIGGDTVRGPLVITVTVLGDAENRPLSLRSQAQCHDDVWITGSLGAPALAVLMRTHQLTLNEMWASFCGQKLDYPTPPLSFIQEIASAVHAAIDVSDGLLRDLGHMLLASSVGAQLFMAAMPAPWSCPVPPLVLQQAVLAGGDDYEWLFCAPPQAREHITFLAEQCLCCVSRIGQIVAAHPSQVCVYQADGSILVQQDSGGFDHFGEKTA